MFRFLQLNPQFYTHTHTHSSRWRQNYFCNKCVHFLVPFSTLYTWIVYRAQGSNVYCLQCDHVLIFLSYFALCLLCFSEISSVMEWFKIFTKLSVFESDVIMLLVISGYFCFSKWKRFTILPDCKTNAHSLKKFYRKTEKWNK